MWIINYLTHQPLKTNLKYTNSKTETVRISKTAFSNPVIFKSANRIHILIALIYYHKCLKTNIIYLEIFNYNLSFEY